MREREWDRDKYESNRALSGIARSRTVKAKQKKNKKTKKTIEKPRF